MKDSAIDLKFISQACCTEKLEFVSKENNCPKPCFTCNSTSFRALCSEGLACQYHKRFVKTGSIWGKIFESRKCATMLIKACQAGIDWTTLGA